MDNLDIDLLGRLDDMYIIKFIKKKLLSMPCQNQGFILDGFPKTYLQTKDLFGGKYSLTASSKRHWVWLELGKDS